MPFPVPLSPLPLFLVFLFLSFSLALCLPFSLHAYLLLFHCIPFPFSLFFPFTSFPHIYSSFSLSSFSALHFPLSLTRLFSSSSFSLPLFYSLSTFTSCFQPFPSSSPSHSSFPLIYPLFLIPCTPSFSHTRTLSLLHGLPFLLFNVSSPLLHALWIRVLIVFHLLRLLLLRFSLSLLLLNPLTLFFLSLCFSPSSLGPCVYLLPP